MPLFQNDSEKKNELKKIRAILSGETERFADFALECAPRIKSLARRFFKNESDIDDFLQDVFEKAFRSLSSFRGESRFSTWIFRIAYTTAINSAKRAKSDLPLADDFDIKDSSPNQEESHFARQTIQAVREAVRGLPEVYARCVALYFFDGLKHSEIAFVLGLPLGSVKSNIFRAKKILAQKLKGESS